MMLANSPTHPNPFPGLRPFESNENHLFFGRDGQNDELLRRLGRKRFLAVVGTSGSGKSSLVRAGLLPALHGGFMIDAGSSWRETVFRPGDDPIGNIAAALNEHGRLDNGNTDASSIRRAITEAALRRSALGLVDVVRQARLPPHENLLIVVDQFEELFRFKKNAGRAKDEAAAFVKLLIEAIKQDEIPIYVVITMRSDFIGDCAQFRDLPEAINDSQYLIPRMTRDQRREAIASPVAVGGATLTPRLMNRLLNDVGDDPDQLPILQHALMRTWQCWAGEGRPSSPLDLQHYEAIGGMSEALSRHADKAYNELPDERGRAIAEKLFKLLTERGSDNREIRRPTTLNDICAVAEADHPEVVAVIDSFRREGRSFLMPPAPVALNSETLIDISHESLIRGWQRLKTWVDEEARSARIYQRLAETAVLYAEGKAGLWREPELFIALSWRDENRPNEAWGARYHPAFASAMVFLDQSRERREAELNAQERQRVKNHRRTQIFATVLSLAFIISLALMFYALRLRSAAIASREDALQQAQLADRARATAEDQRRLAERNQQEAEKATERALNSERKASEDAERARRAEQQASLDAARARAAEQKASDEKQRALAALQDAQEAKQRAERNEQLTQESERRASRLAKYMRKQNYELNSQISLLADKLAQDAPLLEQAKWKVVKMQAQTQMGSSLNAVNELTQVLDADPTNYGALLLRSRHFLSDGRAEKTVEDARSALKLNQNSFVARGNLVLGLGALGRYAEATEEQRAVVNAFIHAGYDDYNEFVMLPELKNATQLRVLYADSRDAVAAFNYEGATLAAAAGTDDFEAALTQAAALPQTTDAPLLALNWTALSEQMRPDDYGALAAQGALWEQAGFRDNAVRSYARFQCAHQGSRFAEQQRYARLAKWVSNRMAQLVAASVPCPVPDPPPVKLDARGQMLETLEALTSGQPGVYERALAAAATEPKDVDILLQTLQIRYFSNDFPGTSRDADAVVRLAPRTALAYVYRALAKVNLGGSPEEIRRDLKTARELDPTAVPLAEDLTKGVYKISKLLDVDDAVDLIQRTARYNNPSALPYYEVAKLLNEKQRYPEALENISRAIAIKVDELSFYDERARAEAGMGRDRAAVMRNQALGYLAAGDTMLRLGKEGNALYAFGESLRLLNNSVTKKNIEELRCEAATALSKVSRIIEESKKGMSALDAKRQTISQLEAEFGELDKLEEILKSQVDRLNSEINNLSKPR